MNSFGIHVEKPTLLHTLIYLLALNIFWSLILLFANYFNILLSNPLVVITGSCFVWHTLCSVLGIEVNIIYPKNILFHLLGSLITFISIGYLVGY